MFSYVRLQPSCSAVHDVDMSASSASCPCPHRTWQDGQGHSSLEERIRLPQYRDLGTRQIATNGSHGADCPGTGRGSCVRLHSTQR